MTSPISSTQSCWHCSFDTGIITPACRELFETAAGISLPSDHISNVAARVDAAIGYVDDVNVIRKEGKSPDRHHAEGFLKYHAEQQKDFIDIERARGKKVVMLMLGGAPLSVSRRALAVQAAVANGVQIDKLRIYVRKESERSATENLVKTIFKQFSLNINPDIHVVGDVSSGLLEAGLAQTKGELAGIDYMMASDSLSCNRIEMMAKKSLDEVNAKCVGVVAVSIKDYQQDILLAKARTAQEVVEMTLENKVPADLVITEKDIEENARVKLWFEAKGLHVANEEYMKKIEMKD